MSDPYGRPGLKSRVDRELERFVGAEAEALLALDDGLAPLVDVLTAVTARGKRLRSAFCYWGWRAAGRPDSDAMVRAAASMELVHAAAVVHDDIIDESALRHGMPTAHVALREVFADGPRPKARARSMAMLAGDLLMSWAGQMFAGCGLPAAYLGRARGLWAVLARELIAGEALEILHTEGEADVRRSMKVIRYKTAKYTVEHPLHIGAGLGGAHPALREVFTDYGLPLGEAFQLRDDLIGLFGDPATTGKPNTDDISAARPTALIALTRQAATPAEQAELTALLGRRTLTAPQLRRVRAVVERTGARDRVEDMISERVKVAVCALDGAGLPDVAHRSLTRLADAATDRPD